MHRRTLISRSLAAAAAVAALAACSGDGGTTVDALTPAQVSGVYRICQLEFAPTQTALPAANVLATVVNAGAAESSLRVSGTAPEYQIVYTRRSDSFLQQMVADVSLRSSSVRLEVPGDAGQLVTRELLLPDAGLTLNFTDNPRRLTNANGGSTVYSVRRADYARAAGITEEGLQDRINGRLFATFSTAPCS